MKHLPYLENVQWNLTKYLCKMLHYLCNTAILFKPVLGGTAKYTAWYICHPPTLAGGLNELELVNLMNVHEKSLLVMSVMYEIRSMSRFEIMTMRGGGNYGIV